ncbi:MAG: flagellar basal-body MS-ring/collar protein FliF [Gammaproteobacteria bacterium]
MDNVTLKNEVGGLAGLMQNAAARQLLAMVGIAASVALGVAIILWTRAPNHSVLFANLPQDAAAEVAQALDAAGIEYKIQSSTGAILVPTKVVDDARLKLAAEGIPGDGGSGLELMQEDPAFGLSQFMEQKRYHHALEIELGRSIAKLKPVRSARVHLAQGKESVFVRDRTQTTASVVLDVRSGRALGRDQVASIVHMVASSIPNLDAKAVTVVDQFGQLLSTSDETRDSAMSNRQFEQTRKQEEKLVKQIESLLAPIVGYGRVRAQVVADLDFTVSELTEEAFDPRFSAVRSEQSASTENRGLNGGQEGGIPGALTNQPPVTGQDAQANAAQGDAAALSTTRNDVKNYDTGRRITTTQRPVGDIKRLWVAVVVDDVQTVQEVEQDDAQADEGQEPVIISTPRTEEELADIERLVRDAVGFDEARGDTITVLNKAFQLTPTADEPAAAKFWEKAWFADIIRQGLGVLLVLIVIFKVLKPMATGLVKASTASLPPAYAALPDNATPALAGAGGNLALPAGEAEEPQPTIDERITAAKSIASEDPERVANIMKEWVGSEDD